MMDEEVVNVGGEEIAVNGEDPQKIKRDHCNGHAHAKKKNENGNVGDVQNDVVPENEICDNVDADVDHSDRDWEVVAVQNGVVETAEEVEIPDVPVVLDASESVNSNVQKIMRNWKVKKLLRRMRFLLMIMEESLMCLYAAPSSFPNR